MDTLATPTLISIISPIYRAEKILNELVTQIENAVTNITLDYEIILVEDGSPDNSWTTIEEICSKNPKVKGIKLSRNFGQHYAVTAGVSQAEGEYIILMDCDLQDDPKYIPELFLNAKKGIDIVFTQRLQKKTTFLKKLTSSWYNYLFQLLSNKEYNISYGSLVLFNKKVRAAFLSLKERDRLYVQMLKWVGFTNTFIVIEHNERYEGTSSYSLYKLIKLGLQGWVSHSNRLLYLTIYLGSFISLSALIACLVIVYQYFHYGFQAGWPSLITAILFSTGLILISLGILGIYIGKIFDELKARPLFIIDRKININN